MILDINDINSKEMTNDIKQQHKSELAKLKNIVSEINRDLEIKELYQTRGSIRVNKLLQIRKKCLNIKEEIKMLQ